MHPAPVIPNPEQQEATDRQHLRLLGIFHYIHGGLAMLGLVFLLILSGGLVAGTDAGFAYSTWPLMGPTFVPESVYSGTPAWLDAFEYGNRDISGGQDRFWLSSSLEISAVEQLRFMAALDAEALPASPENQAIVKQMLAQDENLPAGLAGAVYGKTGSCIGEPVDHGWFTGFYHRDGRQYVFAVNVKGKKQWGRQAREIAVKVLNDLP